MNILVVDIGGTAVKILVTGQSVPRKFHSGPKMTPQLMVPKIKELAAHWKFKAASIGYPGLVLRGRIAAEPYNLAPGWIGFDFENAFGTLLFLGLGTGLGSALVMDGKLVPMELGHLSYKNQTIEDYVGDRGLKRLGKDEWQRHVEIAIARLVEAFHPDDVVIGGGNARNMKSLPNGCRIGSNANAFLGGFRLWS
jgi:predicted NBD/HSP70 family sugar kinase